MDILVNFIEEGIIHTTDCVEFSNTEQCQINFYRVSFTILHTLLLPTGAWITDRRIIRGRQPCRPRDRYLPTSKKFR